MRTIEKCSHRLRERYFQIEHDSGLTVYVFPKPLTTTHVIFSVRYGAADQTFRQGEGEEWITVPEGVAHFLEHKLFENPDGSDSFERFSAYGADANAYTTCNRTAYLFSCTERFEESLEELLRFVRTPYFTDQTVKKEQGIIAEEIRMYRDNPWERCFQNLIESLYEKNPIRSNICGTEQSIARITPQMLYDCYRAFYRLSNMALVVCGNVTQEQVMAVVNRCLPSKREETALQRGRVEHTNEVYRSSVKARMQVSKPIFSVGILDSEIPSTPKDRIRRDAAMTLLEEILFSRSASFYSDLFEEGLITPTYSYGYSIGETFAFHTLSGESDRPEEVGRRLWDYLCRVKEIGIDPEEFERCRRVLYADEIRGYDSTEEIANNLLSFVFDDAELFEYPAVLESLTPRELEELLCSMLKPSAFCLSVVYPDEEAEDEAD